MKTRTLVICLAIFTSMLCGVAIWHGYQTITFDQQVKGILKQAADANQIPLAAERIKVALKGMDKRGITCPVGAGCFTSVLYRTPDEDMGFWRLNIEQTLADLQAVPKDAAPEVVSVTLLKVRETLVDTGTMVRVTYPDGLCLYPQNRLVAFVYLCILLPLGILGVIAFFRFCRWQSVP